MSLRSMTGFAAASCAHENIEMSCEIRSLNSRYLEIFVKLPSQLRELEDSVKDIVRKRVERAKINCSVAINAGNSSLQKLTVNEDAVRNYLGLLNQVRDVAGIEQPVAISNLLDFKDVLTLEDSKGIDEGLKQALFSLIEDGLSTLNHTRAQEGANLQEDLATRLSNIEKLSSEIEVDSESNAQEEFEKLHERLLKNISENKIDRNRLEMELALISDRVDINEEIVRMRSHLDLFRESLLNGSPAGKRLNFILQEMHREANTMSTKTTKIPVSHRIVTIKEEIERMREQVQNVE